MNNKNDFLTVASLIEFLKTMPQDARIMSEDDWGSDYVVSKGCYFDKEHNAVWIIVTDY